MELLDLIIITTATIATICLGNELIAINNRLEQLELYILNCADLSKDPND